MNATKKPIVRPRVDVFENEAEYLVVADLPGVVKDGVEVRFDHGDLSITGKRGEEAEYHRAFTLPEGIDPETIDARMVNGVLSVHVPKAAAKRARRIEVRAG